MAEQAPPLRAQIRELELSSRHCRIDLIESHPDPAERIAAARSMIQQLAMHRVFDRFTKTEEARLLDRLWPVACPDGCEPRPALFGEGAVDSTAKRVHDSPPTHDQA